MTLTILFAIRVIDLALRNISWSVCTGKLIVQTHLIDPSLEGAKIFPCQGYWMHISAAQQQMTIDIPELLLYEPNFVVVDQFIRNFSEFQNSY